MSLNIEAKKEVVENITEQLASAETLVFAEYRGVSVASMTKLRANARAEGVYLRVLKNTLIRRAVADTKFAGLSEQMVGPLLYGISSDPVAAARVMQQFAKQEEKFVVKAGGYGSSILNADQVAELAAIPSYNELLAKLLGVMQAPVSGFARGLAALALKKEAESASV